MVLNEDRTVVTVDSHSDCETVSTGFGDDDSAPEQTLALAIAKNNENKQCFTNVVVNNSADVYFGTREYYNGPVDVKQYVYRSSVEQNVTNSPRYSLQSDQKVQKVNGNTSAGQNGVQVTKRVLYVAVIVLAALLLVTIAAILLTREEVPTPVPPNYNIIFASLFNCTDSDGNTTGKLHIVDRIDWIAQPPEGVPEPLQLPAPYVIISHSATKRCFNQSECEFVVRLIQDIDIESIKWNDISFNFLVGGDGSIYVGRGWDVVGAHTLQYNDRSIGIGFIGTFNTIDPSEKQISAAKELIEQGVLLGKIDPKYKLLAHSQLTKKRNSGHRLSEEVKSWSHWTDSP